MEIFDQAAAAYDNWYFEKKGAFADMVESGLAFKLLQFGNGMKVLDIGCGTGNFSFKLAGKGCQVTGIDISDEMLKIARLKSKEQEIGIPFLKMDLYELQFAEGVFDAVISMAAFEFIHEPLRALNELFRVTKPGGHILVGTITKDSAWGQFYESEEVRANSVFEHARFKSLSEMKSWKSEKIVNSGECPFIDPLAPEKEFIPERELQLAGTRKGGYACVLWKK